MPSLSCWSGSPLPRFQEAAAAPPTARPGAASDLPGAEHALLLRLQHRALQYFLDNQTPGGLVLDRQRNHGPRRGRGLCSTAATGMGFIALALAAGPPYRLLTPRAAALRVRAGLEAALGRLPSDHGVLPHFVDSATGAVFGSDPFSTVETSWLAAGRSGRRPSCATPSW